MSLVVSNTPWDRYDVDGIIVHVKREDLCCPYPGPSFSKIRGVERYIGKLLKGTIVGVMDTRHSKAGWGVSYVCNQLGYKCVDFYPVLKSDNGLRENQQRASELGAQLYPMKAGMSAVLYNQAKKIMREEFGGIMLPNGLHLQESVDATAEELIEYTPPELLDGTWVVSISSGTLGTGMLKGLDEVSWNEIEVIFHMGYSRSQQTIRKFITDMGLPNDGVELIDEGYEYADKVDNSWIPFPCNEYYDAKAFTWLAYNVKSLREPVVFWNIGS